MTRQIVLDTETTGIEIGQGNRIIEIGCIEMKNRRATGNNFWRYVNPERASEPGALAVHGIRDDFLLDKQKFPEMAQELWHYLEGAELLIHNAGFDLGFLNMEFEKAGFTQKLEAVCAITDTVTMARKLHPGQKNNLDALCKRYSVDNSRRDFHGALLDAQLLADVYLAMTGGQNTLGLEDESGEHAPRHSRFLQMLGDSAQPIPVLTASTAEREAHEAKIKAMQKKGKCLWPEGL